MVAHTLVMSTIQTMAVRPTSGTIKDYGVKAFSAGGYTYYKVSMSSVWSRFRKYREMIYGY
jgi:hypothetical protein